MAKQKGKLGSIQSGVWQRVLDENLTPSLSPPKYKGNVTHDERLTGMRELYNFLTEQLRLSFSQPLDFPNDSFSRSRLELLADEYDACLGDLARSASRVVQINSLCTVFAESEVVSLISRGVESSAIALALHEAIATRVAGMVRRIRPKERIIFAGGAALNKCLHQLVSKKLGVEVTVPYDPQIVGALGAALLARPMRNGKNIAPKAHLGGM